MKKVLVKFWYAALFVAVFGVAVLFLMEGNGTVSEQEMFDNCLDGGGVWDGMEKRCRDDCLTWNETEGCVPL